MTATEIDRSTLSAPRIVGFAGLTSFALIVVAAFVSPPLWDAPGTHAPAARASAYAHVHASRVIASLLIYSVGMALFLCFVVGLAAWLRDRGPRTLPAVLAAAGVVLTTLILAGFVPVYMLSYRTQPPVVAAPLADLTFGLLALSGVPTAVCLGAYAALVIRRRWLPRWTAWVAIVGAATHVLIAASFVSHGAFLSLESPVRVWVPATFFAWIFVTSLALVRA